MRLQAFFAPVSRTGPSAHMRRMEELLAELRKLAARHRCTSNEEVQDLLLDLGIILDNAPAPAFQYRNHPAWDTTWMDLDEAQVDVVLKHGHTVERRLVSGDWASVTEAPK
mgnify:FL=1